MLENLPYFQRHLPEDLSRVNEVINKAVQSDVALISQIGTYIISAGGKRLRPIMTILAGKSVGYDGDKLYALAAMVEFIHTSTLLHDDVVDESDLRRGRETANNLFGNAAAVLVGDFLYTRAFQLMVDSGSMRILEVMADATNIIAEGEVMQLMNIGNIDITEAQYLQVIQYKTAKLFEAAAQVGAILAGASAEQEAALRDYGMYVGTAFQIIDDVLDYSGDPEQIGKNVGDDLAEGKPTLPLIYLMRQRMCAPHCKMPIAVILKKFMPMWPHPTRCLTASRRRRRRRAKRQPVWMCCPITRLPAPCASWRKCR